MYTFSKSLVIAGLLVASAQANVQETAAQVAGQAQDAVVEVAKQTQKTTSNMLSKSWEKVSALPGAAVDAGSSVLAFGKTMGKDVLNYGMSAETIKAGGAKYWTVVTAKALAITALAVLVANGVANMSSKNGNTKTVEEEDGFVS